MTRKELEEVVGVAVQDKAAGFQTKEPPNDWSLGIARAALSAIESAGHEIREIKPDLTPEEVESITGITDVMRGTASKG